MADSKPFREIIERVVSATLATHVASLKDEIVAEACRQLEAAVPAAAPPAASLETPPGGAPTDLLNAAVSSVLDSVTQTDILTSLLEGSSKFAARAALLVIRGGNATGWRSVGLEPSDEIKSVTVDLNRGLAARAYHDRIPASAAAAEFDSGFLSTFGAPADGTNVLVLPLVLRDKVAALVYADAGLQSGGKLDPSALECLVRCSGLWLEIVAARKTGAPAPSPEPPPQDTQKIPRYEEAAPPPEESVAQPVEPPPPPAPAPSAPPPPPPVAAPPPMAAPAMAAAAPAPAMASAPAAAPSGLTPEEEEVHKKAKRFAKLLVDEIKLYNQSKVADGRAHKDLYSRLKDDIDKSRATYDKRYGGTSAAGANYFTQELIRILANDDPSLLGEGFSG